MVLELLNQLSAEEGFVTTLFSDGQQAAGTSSVPKKKIRRLSLHNSSNTFASPEARERLSQVRSLTVFGSVDSIPPPSCFPVLRVLLLEDWYSMGPKSYLKDLGNLGLLRFLLLKGTKKIPESIGNLQFLHTLDVTTNFTVPIRRLPKSFVNLRQLVRLVCHGVRLPQGATLGNMKSLQEVVGIHVVTEYEMQQIGTLTELRVLRIELDKDAVGNGIFREALLKCLQSCNELQDLHIGVDFARKCFPVDFMLEVPSGLQRFFSHTTFKAFPGWINSSLSSLTTVSIKMETYLRQENLDTLAVLPSLRFLRLRAFGTSEREGRIIIHSTAYAFRCLQHLQFETCYTGLTFQPGAMPKLETLFYACETEHFRDGFDFGLENHFRDGFDFGLENLPSLRHATFELRGTIIDGKSEAEAAIQKALNDNPNHPSFKFIRQS